jgi:hypothetical protein
MKARWLFPVLSAVINISCGGPRPAAVPVSTVTDPEFMQSQRRVWEAWFAGDTATLRLLTPGLVAISQGTPVFSDQEQEIRNSAQFQANGGRLLELSFPEVRLQRFGDVAIMYSTYHLVTVMGSDTMRQAGHATEVFVRQKGAWRNPGWHLDGGYQDEDR